MKKIAIFYHSSVGSTKKISEKVHALLSENFNVEIYSIEKVSMSLNLDIYDGFVIGFPTIHTHPSKRILEFVNFLNKLPTPKPTYIFTTCGLYSANTLRIFAKYCIQKNTFPVIYRVFWGSPASDGTLLVPFVEYFFTFSKRIDIKIIEDLNAFTRIINNEECKLKLPRFKLYSILNYPNKLAGQMITFTIFIHKNVCSKCGKCIASCPVHALSKDDRGYPLFDIKKCENCYRCIHHCPEKALSLSKRKRPKKVLG